jgi:hypothetical protein
MKKKLSILFEWIRPIGILVAYFLSKKYATNAISKFHYIGLITVIIMSGTVAFEILFIGGEIRSEKIGYKPNRPYEIQSGLSNLATAVTAFLVFIMNWGKYADITIVISMLLFFTFSATNHTITAIKSHNLKSVNLMRPIWTIVLLCFLIPPMINALIQ